MAAQTVAPGSERVIRYVSDDVNFCWLLVRGDTGPLRLHATTLGADPERCPVEAGRVPACCYRLSDAPLVIPNLDSLPLAEEVLGPTLRALEVPPPTNGDHPP